MPSASRAASTKSETSTAVAFSQVRPKEPIAGTRISAVKASRLISAGAAEEQVFGSDALWRRAQVVSSSRR